MLQKVGVFTLRIREKLARQNPGENCTLPLLDPVVALSSRVPICCLAVWEARWRGCPYGRSRNIEATARTKAGAISSEQYPCSPDFELKVSIKISHSKCVVLEIAPVRSRGARPVVAKIAATGSLSQQPVLPQLAGPGLEC